MRILGIESSCDETAAAVVEDGQRVRSNIIASQHELHARYAGVVPEIASRAHLERIDPVVREAIDAADCTLDSLDAIAVGHCPGLIGSLLVGTSAGKALAWALGIALVGVDHVHAHLHAAALAEQAPFPEPRYPALGLVVSGGHSTLYRMDDPLTIHAMGKTIDDAVGEAYDKAAVILGLGFPGGPKLDKLARDGDPARFDLPRSLLGPASLDFSFSGLKTALLYRVRGKPQGRGKNADFARDHRDLSEADRRDLAASFQEAAVDAVMIKVQRAIDQLAQQNVHVRDVIVGGGVSANSRLRARMTQLGEQRSLAVHLPAMRYCLDNAAMIAGLAAQKLQHHGPDALDLAASPRTLTA